MTIGNFDGVHRGHVALLTELRRQAKTVGGPAVAVTFDPHPLHLLRPDATQPLLTTLEARIELLQANGADHVIILRTTLELLHLRADEFFQQVIRSRLAARSMVEGTNFCFGRNREGDVDRLRDLCGRAEIQLAVVPPTTTADGQPISSSRVRSAILGGAVREAAELLGRPYRLSGSVVVGQRRGQTLGFPTANLERLTTLVPKDGVYAVRVLLDDTVWPGAANVGPNPTFGESARKIEVHLIGFQGELYGRQLALDFIERLRDTRPFADAAQLVEQLRCDVEQAIILASGGRQPPVDAKNS